MSKNRVRVVVILASVRPTRRGGEILKWWSTSTHGTAIEMQADIEVADLRELDLPVGQEPAEPQAGRYVLESTRRWAQVIGAADAFVVITPEYNHSLPASLKNAFDLLGPEWGGKPVAWVSYGNTSAGTRALLAAKQVSATLGMVSVGPDVSLRLAEFDEAGRPMVAARAEMARAALSRTVHQAEALRPLRRHMLDVADLPGGYVAHHGDATDAPELLILQKACWVDEAKANQSFDIPALHEELETVQAALADHASVMVRRGGRLVASVQTWQDEHTLWIGRLMVADDHRRHGLARALLRHAEHHAPASTRLLRLNTGSASAVNLRFYESEGFVADTGAAVGVATLTKSASSDLSTRLARSALSGAGS